MAMLVQVLNLGFNHLVSLPSSVSNLTRMRKLILSYNDLDSKSLGFETMLDIEELHLTANRLTGMPHTFARLSKVCKESETLHAMRGLT